MSNKSLIFSGGTSDGYLSESSYVPTISRTLLEKKVIPEITIAKSELVDKDGNVISTNMTADETHEVQNGIDRENSVTDMANATAPKQKPSVSLEEFVSTKTNSIVSLLSNSVVLYKDMPLPMGYHDFMVERVQHLTPYCHMVTAYGIDFCQSESMVGRYICDNFGHLLSESDMKTQVRDLTRYLVNLYLNFLQCPRNFWEVFPNNW